MSATSSIWWWCMLCRGCLSMMVPVLAHLPSWVSVALSINLARRGGRRCWQNPWGDQGCDGHIVAPTREQGQRETGAETGEEAVEEDTTSMLSHLGTGARARTREAVAGKEQGPKRQWQRSGRGGVTLEAVPPEDRNQRGGGRRGVVLSAVPSADCCRNQRCGSCAALDKAQPGNRNQSCVALHNRNQRCSDCIALGAAPPGNRNWVTTGRNSCEGDINEPQNRTGSHCVNSLRS